MHLRRRCEQYIYLPLLFTLISHCNSSSNSDNASYNDVAGFLMPSQSWLFLYGTLSNSSWTNHECFNSCTRYYWITSTPVPSTSIRWKIPSIPGNAIGLHRTSRRRNVRRKRFIPSEAAPKKRRHPRFSCDGWRFKIGLPFLQSRNSVIKLQKNEQYHAVLPAASTYLSGR